MSFQITRKLILGYQHFKGTLLPSVWQSIKDCGIQRLARGCRAGFKKQKRPISVRVTPKGGARLSRGSVNWQNLIALPNLLRGEKLGNMPSVYWSLNYWPVEADR